MVFIQKNRTLTDDIHEGNIVFELKDNKVNVLKNRLTGEIKTFDLNTTLEEFFKTIGIDCLKEDTHLNN